MKKAMHIVCGNNDVSEVKEKLTLCGIKFETSNYTDGTTYFAITDITPEQVNLYESMI